MNRAIRQSGSDIFRAGTCLCIVALVLSCSALYGHEILSLVEVDEILAGIRNNRESIEKGATGVERERALFSVGSAAYSLMKTINADVQSHGFQNRILIEAILKRCLELDVKMSYLKEKEIYLYDFAAFRDYLAEYPEGRFADLARFGLIEKSFHDHLSGEDSPQDMIDRAQEKRQFISDFPDFRRRADAEMFLALDYYELFALYEEQGEQDESRRFRSLAQALCSHILEAYPDSNAAEMARELMIRLGT